MLIEPVRVWIRPPSCADTEGNTLRNIASFIGASAGNRTRAARVAGEHSTTEPTMHISEKTKFCNDISPCEEMFDTEKNVLAVGRIRTYAPRGKLISSQSP